MVRVAVLPALKHANVSRHKGVTSPVTSLRERALAALTLCKINHLLCDEFSRKKDLNVL